VGNTGHIITFKVILQLSSSIFNHFYSWKVCTSDSTSHIWSNLHGSGMSCTFFKKKKGQLADVTLGKPNSGHPHIFLKENNELAYYRPTLASR
jgi:hypothetical protein